MELRKLAVGTVIDQDTAITIKKTYNGGVRLQHAFMLTDPNSSAESFYGKGCLKFVAGYEPAER